MSRQRQAYKIGKLSEGRVQRLEDLGFLWGRGTIPNSKRCPARGSRPRSDASVAGEGEDDGGRGKKRRYTAAADDDAMADSALTSSGGG